MSLNNLCIKRKKSFRHSRNAVESSFVIYPEQKLFLKKLNLFPGECVYRVYRPIQERKGRP